jgi:hypothetical protein
MAFLVLNFDSDKSGVYGTALQAGLYLHKSVNTVVTRDMIILNWDNLGNYSTAGTSSTSGTGGTTIIAAGNYTWIG